MRGTGGGEVEDLGSVEVLLGGSEQESGGETATDDDGGLEGEGD